MFDVFRLTNALPPIKPFQINSNQKADKQKVPLVSSDCSLKWFPTWIWTPRTAAWSLGVLHNALSKVVWRHPSSFRLAFCFSFDPIQHEKWNLPWIGRQRRQDHKQIAMAFSPVFDDAVLPQAFVSRLGHSCQTRCYPRSPPKNLRPRATAPPKR